MVDRPRKNTPQDLLDNSKATQVRLFATTLLAPGQPLLAARAYLLTYLLTDVMYLFYARQLQ